MSDTRIPTQKRSIEKRNRIIEKGFELMCEKGYYNISTPDIAEAAEVSTGIIYQYFNDKKDIFIEGVKNYANTIMFPMLTVLEGENIKIDNIEARYNKDKELYNFYDSKVESITTNWRIGNERLESLSKNILELDRIRLYKEK